MEKSRKPQKENKRFPSFHTWLRMESASGLEMGPQYQPWFIKSRISASTDLRRDGRWGEEIDFATGTSGENTEQRKVGGEKTIIAIKCAVTVQFGYRTERKRWGKLEFLPLKLWKFF